MKGLEDQLARLRQAQAASGQQAAALRERLRRLQNADARGRTYLQTSAGEVRHSRPLGSRIRRHVSMLGHDWAVQYDDRAERDAAPHGATQAACPLSYLWLRS